MAIMPHARAKTEPPATRHPSPVTRHPLPLTRHPLPVTCHPPPATRGKVRPGWKGYLNLPRHPSETLWTSQSAVYLLSGR